MTAGPAPTPTVSGDDEFFRTMVVAASALHFGPVFNVLTSASRA